MSIGEDRESMIECAARVPERQAKSIEARRRTPTVGTHDDLQLGLSVLREVFVHRHEAVVG